MAVKVSFELPMGDGLLVDSLTLPSNGTVWMKNKRVGHIIRSEAADHGHALQIVIEIEDETIFRAAYRKAS